MFSRLASRWAVLWAVCGLLLLLVANSRALATNPVRSSQAAVEHPGIADPGSHITPGPVTSVEHIGAFQFLVNTTTTSSLVSVVSARVIHIETLPIHQEFGFPWPRAPIVVGQASFPVPSKVPVLAKTHHGHQIHIRDSGLVLQFTSDPLRFSLYHSPSTLSGSSSRLPDDDVSIDVAGLDLVWEETEPLKLARGSDPRRSEGSTHFSIRSRRNAQYFGGGSQHGRYALRGETIQIARDENWDEGGHPNSAPFYLSTAGYGVLRNTFAPGAYIFSDQSSDAVASSSHHEPRFDAYLFWGPDFKTILDDYTRLTGRPIMPPIYGLEMGDSDCYLHNANRGERHTFEDALAVAHKYVEHDMPIGWMLVNDGYGCGYENLPETATALSSLNITMGLWTESNLTNQPFEIGPGQVRIRKLDVAWVGSGYDMAFESSQVAYEGIETYSDARGFVWMVEGWAGTQRYAVMWTGDQKGTWNNVRMHVPTFHSAGLSGMPWTAGDIDGIWLGSPETYVRDLQAKAFSPVLMSMSGWSWLDKERRLPVDKQPWTRGEPFTSINRKYLKLREQLLPYLYTYAREAHSTGVPPVRSLILEYSHDPVTWTDRVKYEFLFGTNLLVAPVYDDRTVRDDIYFPEGAWYDFWKGAVVSHGKEWISHFDAPLDVLPLFVKAGSVLPMWQPVNSWREHDRSLLALEIWALGRKGGYHFELYEDDMVTREFQAGKFATQLISVREDRKRTPLGKCDTLAVDLRRLDGEYAGRPERRTYTLRIFHPKLSGDAVLARSQVNSRGWTLARASGGAAGRESIGEVALADDGRGPFVKITLLDLETDEDWHLGVDCLFGAAEPALVLDK
ncbi:glycosyl hydrolases family 31-domain-containing protein [Polychytrium aggregatum]|uniref:glycosyl hydrolases family 31-domain-containing protein n=1 Tax=Polychytrium aggregatum TaxID=110093 RepID=UPI0022FED1D7|nr:glycosyl hydrolases family 31-domain-containing protein [Polychytrium aggregatum]KAI9209771.1 glycosyl hydrolases family 31-domain-containing protein [Polychytrium aggregatum]